MVQHVSAHHNMSALKQKGQQRQSKILTAKLTATLYVLRVCSALSQERTNLLCRLSRSFTSWLVGVLGGSERM